MYILDAYVINELRKLEGLDGSAALEQFAKSKPAQDMFVSAASLTDIANAINDCTSIVSRTLLEGWFYDHLLVIMKDQTLPLDAETIKYCRVMKLGPAGVSTHALIAAQAILKGMTIVTRHPELYAHPGISILNPWREIDMPKATQLEVVQPECDKPATRFPGIPSSSSREPFTVETDI